MFDNYPDVVTVKEITQMLRLSNATVYKMLKDDRIKKLKCGKSFRVLKKSVIDLIDS